MSTMINDEPLGALCAEIIREIHRSRIQHPHYPDDSLRRTAITLEEALEAIGEMVKVATEIQRCALQVARLGNEQKYATIADLRKELIHMCAMGLKQLQVITEEDR